MKKSPVFFADMSGDDKSNIPGKIDDLLSSLKLEGIFGDKELVAIKLQLAGEGNPSCIGPDCVKKVADRLKSLGATPFLTDTNTLHVGARGEAVSLIRAANESGFGFSEVLAPVIIADGLKSENSTEVYVGSDHFDEVKIGGAVSSADGIIALTNIRPDGLTGFGGALKSLGMGCAAREGKLAQYGNLAPVVGRDGCNGCATCIRWCPSMATYMTEGRASIDPQKCEGCGKCIIVCPKGTIEIEWSGAPALDQAKMTEYALGVVYNKKWKGIFVNFIVDVFPECDCCAESDTPIVPDVGIVASRDPVALDQASVDLVNGERGLMGSSLAGGHEAGEDKFKGLHPEVEWETQLKAAEALGIGSREYELIKI